jgi:hypothetical protein
MLRTRNIGAYRDLLVLFMKYGRKDFRLALQPKDLLVPDHANGAMESDVKARAQAFATSLKADGPDVYQVWPDSLDTTGHRSARVHRGAALRH